MKILPLLSLLLLMFCVEAMGSPILSANFDTGDEGFTYADDTFRGTNQPAYASGNYDAVGGFSGGGLHAAVGGIDAVSVTNGMSGGWSKSFVLSGDGTVSVSLRYRLIFAKDYEPDECGQALVAIDGTLVSPGPGDYLKQFCGTNPNLPVDQDSGWQQVTFEVTLTGGTHTLTVGGWNNKKTGSSEKMEVFFDEIILAQSSVSILFSDDFNDGNADGWTVVNNSGSTSDWQVVNGEYNQTKAVGKFSNSYPTGSYSYYSNGLSLVDYRVAADITALNSSSSNDTVGLMFRYQNANNYYRFSMSRRQGYSRLEKKVNGVFSTLAFDGRGFTFNQLQRLAVEVRGSKILVYLNNDPLFAVMDSSIANGSIALFTQNKVKFDNIVITEVTSIPRIIISTPTAYSIETTDNLSVSAVATNVPSGGGVEFVLDKGTTSESSFLIFAEPYGRDFQSVPLGEHTIDAFIIDSSGMPISDPGARDRDHNRRIGVSGLYFVAFGDSITRGVGDDVPSDDISADGRNINWGYTAILNNLLSSSLPITVMNEGLGGTTSTDGLKRLNATIAQYPESRYWLIMFGTNDSGGTMPLPSGRGLSPGDPGYTGSYKDKMQKIITGLKNAGKVPLLAKVPITLGSCSTCAPFPAPSTTTRNLLIQEYNVVIDELVATNGIPVIPPDFYSYFADHQEEFSDRLHLNGTGYQSMANLWFNELSQSGILP